MNKAITCQDRLIQQSDFCGLRNLVQKHPNWSRHKITKHICSQWKWCPPSWQLKTFVARSIIGKLEQRGLIDLSPTREDPHTKLSVPVKDILMHPLTKNFRQALCQRGA